jgi:hypothetical protein
MRDAKQAAFTGRAGEYAVATQLLLREVPVLWPAVDTGFDLMTMDGCRVQVKCAHIYNHKNGPRYTFPLPKNRRLPNSDKTTKLVAKRPFREICDYVVFWGIEQNRFWVTPAHLCDEITGIELGYEPSLRRFKGSVSDMREMLALGYNRGQVAKHYGIARTSLQQFLDSGKDAIGETVASQIRACESRWDFILNFTPSTVAQSAPVQESKES